MLLQPTHTALNLEIYCSLFQPSWCPWKNHLRTLFSKKVWKSCQIWPTANRWKKLSTKCYSSFVGCPLKNGWTKWNHETWETMQSIFTEMSAHFKGDTMLKNYLEKPHQRRVSTASHERLVARSESASKGCQAPAESGASDGAQLGGWRRRRRRHEDDSWDLYHESRFSRGKILQHAQLSQVPTPTATKPKLEHYQSSLQCT